MPKPDAFVIMPIENPVTEPLWKGVYVPVLEAAGFVPRRVDKDDDGSSMLTQIVQYLVTSPLIIADLTLARPNCYFEVGYVMGLSKHSNLILCCREDHNPDSPRFDRTAHKIHFDVQSYSVVWWADGQPEEFKARLAEKIEQRRRRILEPIPVPAEPAATGGKRRSVRLAPLEKQVKHAESELKQWKRKT